MASMAQHAVPFSDILRLSLQYLFWYLVTIPSLLLCVYNWSFLDAQSAIFLGMSTCGELGITIWFPLSNRPFTTDSSVLIGKKGFKGPLKDSQSKRPCWQHTFSWWHTESISNLYASIANFNVDVGLLGVAPQLLANFSLQSSQMHSPPCENHHLYHLPHQPVLWTAYPQCLILSQAHVR